MKLCCEWFKQFVDDHGKRGLSAIAKKINNQGRFFLQARAFDAELESKMKNIPKDCDIPNPLSVATQVAINYCPHCGTNLVELIENNLEEFSKLVDKHETLAM